MLSRKALSDEQYYQWKMARWKARTDLLFLCRDILGYRDVDAEVHGPILRILQQFPVPNSDQFWKHDEMVGSRWVYKPVVPMYDLPGARRVLILDPRGFLKTTINAQSHVIQWILNYPDIAIMIIQSNSEKAESILCEIKRHFQANPRFRQLFPEHCPQKRIFDWGTKGEFTTEARGVEITRKEKTVMTGSIDKGSAGYHFDVMKFSDIVEPNNVKTPEQISSVIQSFGMFENLTVRPDSWIDVEGTRYDFSDLYGEIIRAERERPPEHREWRIHVRGCYKKDTGGAPPQFTPEELDLPYLKDEKGEKISWWPSRFSVKEMEKRRTNPAIGEYIFACLRQGEKILMSNWREKNIEDVRIGDEVVGFTTAGRPTFCPAKVIATHSRVAPVYKLTLASGHVTYCTADHLWYTGRKGYDYERGRGHNRKLYDLPKIGRKVIRAYDNWEVADPQKFPTRLGVPDRIVDIEPVGEAPVYCLTTETGNYVGGRLLSGNCQQLNNPVEVGDLSQVPFPVNKEFPKWITRENFMAHVRVAYATLTVDTAETVTDRADYSAITTFAWDQYGRPYCVDIVHGKFLPDELIRQVIGAFLKASACWSVMSVTVEETAFVRGLLPSLQRIMDTRRIYIPLKFVKRDSTQNKKERILNTLQPWYRSGELRFLSDLGPKENLLLELTRFPRYKHDDILDSLADQFQGKTYFGRLQSRPTFGQIQAEAMDKWLGIDNPWEDNSPGCGVFDTSSKTGGL